MFAPTLETTAKRTSTEDKSSEVGTKPENEIVIRPAHATFEEGSVYAKLLDQAADGFIRVMLGAKFANVIADAFVTPAHDFSFSNVIVAERNGMIIGSVAGYTAQQHARCSDEVLRQSRGFSALRMSLVNVFAGSLWRFLNTIDDDDFYLQSIAVTPDCRGEGIGSMLMSAMEQRAAETDATRLVLDVAEKNEGARRLYERHGMTVTAKWPSRLRIPRYRVLRMTRPLGNR